MKRFYAEHTTLSSLFASQWPTGWQVFDRNYVSTSQATDWEPQSIAFTISRDAAFIIRDALNTSASIKSQERAAHRLSCKHWAGCIRVGQCLHFTTICQPRERP